MLYNNNVPFFFLSSSDNASNPAILHLGESAVHAAKISEDRKFFPICGGNRQP